MKPFSKKTLFVVALSLFVLGLVPGPSKPGSCLLLMIAHATAAEVPSPTPVDRVPRLLGLGASYCAPCRLMAPIYEELAKEYAGRMQVDFIDVWKDPEAAQKYGIKVIPTQIFFDASGKELFRHEGVLAKNEILAKWKELGIDFGEKIAAH